MTSRNVLMTKRQTPFAAALLATALSASSVDVRGQSSPPATPPATAPAQPGDSAPPKLPKPPPSALDDLLNIDKEKEKPGETPPANHDAAAEEAKRELDKQLTEAEVSNAFVQAMEKMSVAADLLDVKFDAGLDTQRIQEDIIAKLAQLLDQARRNQQQSSSSSSSSSSQQQQQRQQQQQQQQNPGQRQQNQREQDGQQRNQDPADNRSEMDPPPGQDANPNSVLEESRSEWGNLPQRLREQLLQGRRDHMPSLYRRMIDEYYKRLAEEGST